MSMLEEQFSDWVASRRFVVAEPTSTGEGRRMPMLEEQFSGWVASRRFVVAGPVVSWPRRGRRGAGRVAGSRWRGGPDVPRSVPGAPGRWRRLAAVLVAALARWQRR